MRTFFMTSLILGLPIAAVAQTAPAQPPAPETMSRQDLRDEVTQLRQILGAGAVRPSRPAGCTSAEQRQFDFWLGQWDVAPSSATTGVIVAESSITLHDQGCVVMEEWRPFAGGHGHSINNYDAEQGKWRQAWVDSSGRRTDYSGSFDGQAMRLDDVSGNGPGSQPGQRSRMNYQRIDENTVRQWGENLNAETGEWTVTWDLTYRRRAGTR